MKITVSRSAPYPNSGARGAVPGESKSRLAVSYEPCHYQQTKYYNYGYRILAKPAQAPAAPVTLPDNFGTS